MTICNHQADGSLVFELLICELKEYGVYDTEYPYWDQATLTNIKLKFFISTNLLCPYHTVLSAYTCIYMEVPHYNSVLQLPKICNIILIPSFNASSFPCFSLSPYNCWTLLFCITLSITVWQTSRPQCTNKAEHSPQFTNSNEHQHRRWIDVYPRCQETADVCFCTVHLNWIDNDLLPLV